MTFDEYRLAERMKSNDENQINDVSPIKNFVNKEITITGIKRGTTKEKKDWAMVTYAEEPNKAIWLSSATDNQLKDWQAMDKFAQNLEAGIEVIIRKKTSKDNHEYYWFELK